MAMKRSHSRIARLRGCITRRHIIKTTIQESPVSVKTN